MVAAQSERSSASPRAPGLTIRTLRRYSGCDQTAGSGCWSRPRECGGRAEDIRRADQVNLEFINLARPEQLHLIRALAVARAENTFADVHREAVRVNVN